MTKRNVLIIALAVATALLICLIGLAISLSRGSKEPVEAPNNIETVEATNEPTPTPTNGTNVSADGEVIGDETRLPKFVSETTAAYKVPSIESDHAAVIAKGTSVLVTKHSTKGWCEIEYNGEKMYIDAKYLVEEMLDDEGEYPIDEDSVGNEVEEDVEPTEPQYSEDGVYLIVNEEVRAEGNVWLRSAPKMSGKEVVILGHGRTITRVGIGSNGWSQVLYNDEILYVTTYWVTPTKSPKYQEVQEFVKLTESANLRESGSINSRKIAALPNGVEMVRIGISQHGWSKVIYKGHVRYIYTLYVTPIDREVTEADLEIKSE